MKDELTPKRAALRSRIASLSGRVGAATRQARPGYSGKEATRAATSAYWSRLCDECDPRRELSDDERLAKAKALWRSRMLEGQLRRAQSKLREVG